jgi:hypothetical protein
MHVNGKIRPVETIPRIVRGKIKENGRRSELKYNIFDIL